ncbi:MAG: right-handed parallel beta-helix repeat-containing protein, partial [Candidatus Micrarchaeota archaeon]
GSIYNGDGIALYHTNNSAVVNATVNESYAGAFTRYCQNTSLRDSYFSNNTYGALDESHAGSNYTLQNNTLLNISSVGVYLYSTISGGGVTVFNNTIRSSATGVLVTLTLGNNVSYNNLTNSTIALSLVLSNDNVVQGNQLLLNTAGLMTLSATNNSIDSNEFYGNTGGVLEAGGSNRYSNNNYSFSTQGLYLAGVENVLSYGDLFYNNTYGVYLDTASNNNVSNAVFDNNTYHLGFVASTYGYVINSTFSNHVTNQSLSDTASSNYLVNCTGMNASLQDFVDLDSELALAYFVNVTVFGSGGAEIAGATVQAQSNQSTLLYTASSPVTQAVTPVYLARGLNPLNYSPLSFTASYSGYGSSTVYSNVPNDTQVNITLTLLAGGGGSSGGDPSCDDCDSDGVCKNCCEFDPDCVYSSPTPSPQPSYQPTPTSTPSPSASVSPAASPPLAPPAASKQIEPSPSATVKPNEFSPEVWIAFVLLAAFAVLVFVLLKQRR